MNLILIEGLPGTGKSTMAEMLRVEAQANGIRSDWYLEELKDHPVHPVEIKHDKYKKNFHELCLKQWAKFISENKNSDHLFILEGSLFQSTIRFMLEGNNQALIADYYSECLSILSSVNPKLVYLRPVSTDAHLQWAMEYRGEEWSSRVTGYLESTPYCMEHGWKGKVCMVSFWSKYAQLCDSLIEQTSIPYHTIQAGNGYFEAQYNKAIFFDF